MNIAGCIEGCARWRRSQLGVSVESAKSAERAPDGMVSNITDAFMSFANTLRDDLPGMTAQLAFREVTQMYGAVLRSAEPYIVRGAASRLVISAAESVPDALTLRRTMFRSPCGLLFFASGRVKLPGGPGGGVYLAGIGWYTVSLNDPKVLSVFIYGFGSGSDHCQPREMIQIGPSQMLRWEFGKMVVESGETDVPATMHMVESILMAALLFMEEKVLVEERMTRADRRQLSRRGPDLAPMGMVVTLREAVKRGSGGGNGSGRKLTARHLRRGHWTKHHIKDQHPMFDPSLGLESQVWARYQLPIIIGDPSLPFREPGDRVFDVRR